MNRNKTDNGFGCIIVILSFLRIIAYPVGLYWSWDMFPPHTFWQFLWFLLVGGVYGWILDLIISGIMFVLIYLTDDKN